MRDGKVNWCKGALQPYESWASIAVKFCFFNQVGHRDFIQFCRETWIEEIPDTFRVFSAALGEPAGVARTLSVMPLLPPIETVGIQNSAFATLRYCPECIRVGYHATFHQLIWFDRCLIHGRALLPESCGMFHDKQVRADFHVSEKTVRDLSALFRQHGVDSHLQRTLSEIPPRRSLAYRSVKQYCQWIATIKANQPPGANPAAFFWDGSSDAGQTRAFSSTQSARLISDRLHCIHALLPCPEKVRLTFHPTRINGVPVVAILQEGPGALRENPSRYFADLFANMNLLLDLFRIEGAFNDASWPKTTQIRDSLTQIRTGHEVCIAHYAQLADQLHWDDETIPPFDAICPKTIFSKEFERQWATPTFESCFGKQCGLQWNIAQAHYLKLLHARQLICYAGANDALNGESAEPEFFDGTNWKLASIVKAILQRLLEAQILASNWMYFENALHTLRHTSENVQQSQLQPTLSLLFQDERVTRLVLWLRTPSVEPDWAHLEVVTGEESHAQQVQAWMLHASRRIHAAQQRIPSYDADLSEHEKGDSY